MNEIILPRKDEDGRHYISYSQLTTFTDDSGFNTGLPGMYEYFQSYFFGKRWPDQGWALFGTQVEDYICYWRESPERIAELDAELAAGGQSTITDAINAFSDKEKALLQSIEPLGNFQVRVELPLFDNVYLLGYIDDANDDLSIIRDYKTASKTSKARYYKDSYKQLDLYSLWVLHQTGVLPKVKEVKIIERKGNCFGMVERRDLLTVGGETWTLEKEATEEKLFMLEAWMKKQVLIVSDYYKLFLKVNV